MFWYQSYAMAEINGFDSEFCLKVVILSNLLFTFVTLWPFYAPLNKLARVPKVLEDIYFLIVLLAFSLFIDVIFVSILINQCFIVQINGAYIKQILLSYYTKYEPLENSSVYHTTKSIEPIANV